MNNSLNFRIFGFDVEVQPGFLLLVGIYLLFALQAQLPLYAGISFAVVVFVSILVHELGHAWTARWFRLPVGAIHIHGFGGHVTHAATAPRNQLAISVAGPFAGLALGLATLAVEPLLPASPVIRTVVADLLWVNIGWSLFNLLPMYPLDGGNAMRSLLALRLPQTTAMRATAITGLALGAAVAVFGLTYDEIFLMFIGGMVAYTNYQALQSGSRQG